MEPWLGDIEQETLGNDTFRTVVLTGEHTQLTVMSIEPGDDIGGEVHDGHDQFIRIESGAARVELGGSGSAPEHVQEVGEDWAVIIPAAE
jgi:mannose-6-phosphate isomerase-like protein (cupin superfamily)